MTRRAYFYFIVTFALGIVLGGVGTYYCLWHGGRIVQHPAGFNKARAEAHLKKELNLSDAQLQQIDLIFDDSSKKLADLGKQVDPQFQAIHLETRGRIRQVLDAGQAKKFDELLRQLDERRRRHGMPSPPTR